MSFSLSLGKGHLRPLILQSLDRTTIGSLSRHGAISRNGHTVRVIVKDDLPNGKAYEGDVIYVKAGYARNYLLPQKKAVYATRQNFQKLGLKDPNQESPEERRARLEKEAVDGEDKDLKAADMLRHYLRNKVLKIWRNIDPTSRRVTPGMVDARAVRQKLSKQLKIDLEPHEKIHLRGEPLVASSIGGDSGSGGESEIEDLLQQLDPPDVPCKVQIRQLGEYLARISLRGGHSIPLRIEVLKR